MTEFNMWCWNSRVFPGIDHLAVRRGDRVRIRMGNLTMTNHPMHLHGYSFSVTGTDGGWVPASAQWPEVTTDIPVGAMRAVEFDADVPGDWAFHRSEEHTSELQSLMRISYAVFCLKNKKRTSSSILHCTPYPRIIHTLYMTDTTNHGIKSKHTCVMS